MNDDWVALFNLISSYYKMNIRDWLDITEEEILERLQNIFELKLKSKL